MSLNTLATGAFQATLFGALDHPPGDAELNIAVPYTITAANGDTATATLSLIVNDDRPKVSDTNLEVGSPHDTNLLAILQVSGGMGNPSGLTGLTQLDVGVALFEEVLQRYEQLGLVAVRLVTFEQTASAHFGLWLSPSLALEVVDTLTSNGNTNFDAALTQAQTAFGANGRIGGASNEALFISNGNPNQPVGSAGINGAEQKAWESFLANNQIRSYAIGTNGVGNLVELEAIAFDGQAGVDIPAEVLSDPINPPGIAFTPPVGLSLQTLLTSGGADGAVLDGIIVNGELFAYDAGANAVTSTSTVAWAYTSLTRTLSVPRSNGSRITVAFDTGDLAYSRPPINGGDAIGVRFSDKDGDHVVATITMQASSSLPPLVRRDRVRTNATGVGVTFTIPAELLLANDEAALPLAVLTVNSASDGTVMRTAGNVVFTDNDVDGGSFVYVAQAGGLTSSARVSIDRAQAGDTGLDGTGLGEILLGRSTASTLRGYEGNDVLIGGEGNDTLDGGDGDDVLRGNGGNDSINVGLGNDRIEWVSPSDGFDFVTSFDGDPTGGQDVVDLRRLFDALGVPAGSRGVRVQLVDNGSTVDVRLNLDTSNPNFEVQVCRLETNDPVTLGADVLVGD